MAGNLWKTYLEMDHLLAIGYFQTGSCSIDLRVMWQVSFSLCPSKLRNDQTKTHRKRERAKQIMKCSIIWTHRIHLKQSCLSHSLCFKKCLLFFLPQVLIESAIKLKPCIIRLYTESLQALTDSCPLLSISQSVICTHKLTHNLSQSLSPSFCLSLCPASVLLNND